QAARAEQAAWHLDAELGRVIEPRETWPRGATVVVEVDGALPTTGTSRMGVPVRASFSVQRGLVIEEVDCGGGRFDDGCGVGPITLLFSNPVPRAQLRHIRPTPPVRGFEIRPGYERETAGVVGLDSAVLWGDFKRGDAI